MRWTESIDSYCERLGPGFWAEPVNALTNAAFLLAAILMWRRARGEPLARALCVLLAAISLGSFLFHTYAMRWAALADTLPILGFILLYLFAVNRHVWGLPVWAALLGTLLFLPWSAALTPLFRSLPGFEVSAFYWPVPLLILISAALLIRRAPATARGLAIGAGILCVSLVFRSLDRSACPTWPLGTHFLWHLLNALMLGWMIHVYLSHRLAARGATG